MPRTSQPLVVAIGAAALLVVVVATDLAIDRTIAIDVRDDGAWREIARHPVARSEVPHPGFGYDSVPIEAGENVSFRLRVDNGYPWAFDEAYRAFDPMGRIAAEGRLAASARGEGAAEFVVPGASFARAVPPGSAKDGSSYVSIAVEIAGERIDAGFPVTGVAS